MHTACTDKNAGDVSTIKDEHSVRSGYLNIAIYMFNIQWWKSPASESKSTTIYIHFTLGAVGR